MSHDHEATLRLEYEFTSYLDRKCLDMCNTQLRMADYIVHITSLTSLLEGHISCVIISSPYLPLSKMERPSPPLGLVPGRSLVSSTGLTRPSFDVEYQHWHLKMWNPVAKDGKMICLVVHELVSLSLFRLFIT